MEELDFLGTLNRDTDRRSESVQVAGFLRAAILTGRYGPGALLPSQPMLKEHFGIARETVKRAYEILENEHLVITRPGSGTYVRASTQRPVELRPHIEKAFQEPTVSIDFAGFSSETLRDAVAEPLDQVRAGRLTPRSIAIRLLLADMTSPLALPSNADGSDSTPVRMRQERITRRAASAIIDQATELGDLGLVQTVSVEVRVHDLPPVFKLYILNANDVFYGFYNVVKRDVTIGGTRTTIFDPMGKDATLFNHHVNGDDSSPGTQFVRASRAWFDSIWSTIARPYTP